MNSLDFVVSARKNLDERIYEIQTKEEDKITESKEKEVVINYIY